MIVPALIQVLPPLQLQNLESQVRQCRLCRRLSKRVNQLDQLVTPRIIGPLDDASLLRSSTSLSTKLDGLGSWIYSGCVEVDCSPTLGRSDSPPRFKKR